jgi:hypothetical protein
VPNKASRKIKQAQERKDRAALAVVDRSLSKIERKRALTVAGVVGKAKVVMIESADQKDFAAELASQWRAICSPSMGLRRPPLVKGASRLIG